jgi:hypothetical protein
MAIPQSTLAFSIANLRRSQSHLSQFFPPSALSFSSVLILKKIAMSQFQLLLVSCFAVLGLASCGEPQASAPETSNAAQAAASPAAGFTALKNVTEKTTAAIQSGKLDDAKATFGKFEDSWKTVEDGVKAKSSRTYNAVEENLDTVNGELKNKQPDKAKLLAALQTLNQTIAMAAKP